MSAKGRGDENNEIVHHGWARREKRKEKQKQSDEQHQPNTT
jgi:hypothetical protein